MRRNPFYQQLGSKQVSKLPSRSCLSPSPTHILSLYRSTVIYFVGTYANVHAANNDVDTILLEYQLSMSCLD